MGDADIFPYENAYAARLNDRLHRNGAHPAERFIDPPLVVPMDVAVNRVYEVVNPPSALAPAVERLDLQATEEALAGACAEFYRGEYKYTLPFRRGRASV